MARRKRTCLAALVAGVLVAAPAAMGAEVTVESTVTGGTRTLTLRNASGQSLDSITLGTVGSAAFLGNVTDLQYSAVGFQVTASLSGLYGFDGSSFDCGTSIDSSSLSLDFLVNPNSLTDVAALPEPTWDLAGTLPAPIATLLGVPVGTAVAAAGVAGETLDRTLAGVFTGAENSLPIKLLAGTGGAFTNPGPHAACAPTPSAPATTYSLMNGESNSLSDVFTWVTAAVGDAADADSSGTVTGSELVSTGEVTSATLAEAVRTALGDAGVDLGVLDTLVGTGVLSMDDIYAILTATVDTLSGLLGQSGTYVSLPKLSVDVPDQTPAGTYRGTLTVTMVDV